MSPHDLVEKLIRSLRFETDLVGRLAEALRLRRTAWIAVRPSQLEEPLQQLEALTREIAAAGAARDELLQQIAALLPLPPTVGGQPRELSCSRLGDHLPKPLAAQLRHAAGAAKQAAGKLRTELLVGDRLLQFTQRAHEGLLRSVLVAAAPRGTTPPGYDRGGRRRGGVPIGAGSLIDGRL
jgi:hypothetical protein